MRELTLGSLFDGSGGFPLAAALEGIRPVWASEVEPYPIAVTRSRFPHMKHYGDVSKINGAEIEPVDILSFGSPCQDLSVAGLRRGLRHEATGDEETTRSGLFLEAIRIIKEMREATNGLYPTFAIWENVTGAFSSSKGEDFRTVLSEFVGIVEPGAEVPPPPQGKWAYADILMGDGWSIAYRVLDAQYWGVPQRRRRIYLVADFRGERAGKILFESGGLRGHNAPSREARQGAAAEFEDGSGAADTESVRGVGINGDIAGTLDASYYKGCGMRQGVEREVVATPPYMLKIRQGVERDSAGKKAGKGPLISEDLSMTPGVSQDQYLFQPQLYENHSQDSRYTGPHEVAPTTNAKYGTGGNNQPLVVYGISAYESNAMKSPNPHSGIYEADTARTIDANGGNPACNQGGMAALQGSMIGRKEQNDPQGNGISEDVCFTLNTIDRHAVAYAIDQQGGKGGANYAEGVMPTLCSDSHGTPHAVAYGIDRAAFNQGENAKYDPQIDEELSATLVARGPNAVAICTDIKFFYSYENKGATLLSTQYKDPPLVCYRDGGQVAGTLTALQGSMIGRKEQNGPQGNGISEDVCFTLNTIDRHAVAYGVDFRTRVDAPVTYNGETVTSPTNAQNPRPGDPCHTLGTDGRNYLVEHLVEQKYIVRRLTPTECCRLQGFFDGWGEIDPKEDFTDEEFEFWLDVRNTHGQINGKAIRHYTKAQMLTWYNKLHTDSAEYKMWGNGVALPCVRYVMQGIVDAVKEDEENV